MADVPLQPKITDILDLPTAELDDTLVLAPDGAGGIEARAEGGVGGSGTFPPAWSPDAAAHTEEFESALSGWTTLGTLDTLDADATVDSHLYMARAPQASINVDGIYQAIPSTPFTVVAKLTAQSAHRDNAIHNAGLMLLEGTPGIIELIELFGDTRQIALVERYTNRTTYNTAHGASQLFRKAPGYLKMTVHSTTSFSSWVSENGLIWLPLTVTQNPGFTIGAWGFGIFNNGVGSGSPVPSAKEAYWDWYDLT